MKTKIFSIFLLCFTFIAAAQSELGSNEYIRPYDEDQRYWQYKNESVLLRGGSNNDNLWQWAGSELTGHLELLKFLRGNYVRNIMSDRDEGDTYAYKEKRNGKYNLDEWNEEYWKNLEFFLEETFKRDIVVQLILWDHFDLSGSFDKHPLNPANSITWNDGVITGHEDYYGGSVKENNRQGLELQNRYIDKLLSLTFKYGNILYTMSNESSLGEEWEEYWTDYVKEQGKEVFITSMHLIPSNGVRL